MFKFLTLFLCCTVVAQAQNCGSYTSEDQNRPVSITIYSPEGECFDVVKQGVNVNPEQATRVQFTVNYGLVPIKVTLANGTVIDKKLAIGDTYITANYRIVANKKGKYKLRFEPFTGTSSGPSAADMVAEMQTKQKAEQAARDKAWDDARAKEQADRDAKKAKERAKEQAEEDARDAEWAKKEEERKARWAADSEKRRQENPGRQGATYDNSNRQGLQGNSNQQGLQGNSNRQGLQGNSNQQGLQGNSNTNSSRSTGSKANSSAPPKEIAEIERDGRKYFETYRKGHEVEFTIMYKGKPACDWDVEILMGDVVVAQGHTGTNGTFSSTYYGLLETSFKVVGKRSNMAWGGKGSWSIGGFWYITEREYQAGKLDDMKLEVFEKYASDSMGINMSFAGYGVTSGCK
ncbi:MAG: hypothetical protein AB8E82_04050 [Aureispira sp.]